MNVSEELLDQLFPEQTEAEQILALATDMRVERVDVDGQAWLYFQIVGNVPIGASDLSGKAGKRLIHFGGMLSGAEFDIKAQGRARAGASKSRRPRTSGRKGGAK